MTSAAAPPVPVPSTLHPLGTAFLAALLLVAGLVTTTPAQAADHVAASPTSAVVAPAAPLGPRAAVGATPSRPGPVVVQSFLRALYTDFLGRGPSAGETTHWGPRVAGGEVQRYDVATALSRSDEWIRTVVTRFYRDTLGREPDASGLAGWTRAARDGMPVAQIASAFYASEEYYRTVGRGDDATWVRDLYRKLLHREGERSGVDGWVRALRQGMRRDTLAFGFYQSPETLQVRIDGLYRTLLGRGAEPGGVGSWSPFVRDNGDLVLAAALAASAEYLQRAQSRYPSTAAPAWAEVVGNGTAASCTAAALAAAVRDGGTIMFSCGPAPVTITVPSTLVTCNTTTCKHPWVSGGGQPVDRMTLDGGGLVTLSGGNARGIFYANACDEKLGWLTSTCQTDTRPHVTFKNITFTAGNAQGAPAGYQGVSGGGGGGAIAMRAGRLTLDTVTFRDNRCVTAHSDAGGGAVRVTGMVQPVTISSSLFERNSCANGGAISSLHAPMVITGSTITANTATGHGASSGLGGNGGGIYFDGTHQDVTVRNVTIKGNVAPEGGPGIFYVSNDRTGTLTIEGSQIVQNSGQSFFTSPYRSIFYLGTSAQPVVRSSTVQ